MKDTDHQKTLRVIFYDQLSLEMTSLKQFDKKHDLILMVEEWVYFNYVKHHKAKIVFIISAMRHFHQQLIENGYRVAYIKLEDTDDAGDLFFHIEAWAHKRKLSRVIMTEPSEWPVQHRLEQWLKDTKLTVEILEDHRFFITAKQFKLWAAGRKQLNMEQFYRMMRQKHAMLMSISGQPEGSQWNFDAANRKPYRGEIAIPKRPAVKNDRITQAVIHFVQENFANHIGHLASYQFAVDREGALAHFKFFIKYCLAHFGDYQDALYAGEDLLFHSVISPYLNVGLLLPEEVCREVERAYQRGLVPLPAAEGFIRQILGWREFVRGIYWLKMPSYKDMNVLDAKQKLPAFYWSGQTKMACMQHAIHQTLERAYAHHIQRLMITGNFALLLGVLPADICEWYLMVYIDAFDWVELPNTLGMSQYGDGGVFATKPYAASGNYISKQSNYCKSCHYNVKEKITEDACPFNFLYWDFIMRQEKRFRTNMRMKFVYATLDKMPSDLKKAIRAKAKHYMDNLNSDISG